jgi:DNA-binding transcriptional ArsR family regulator
MTVHGTLKCASMIHEFENNERSGRANDPRIALLKELSEPVRLRVIDRLGHGGPATVSRLAAELGVSLPQLSNHLRRLRDAGLVTVERTGRHGIYKLADPGLELLLPLLDRITGRLSPADAAAPPSVPSRTCYDHLGGRIGVSLYSGLLERDAVRERPDGIVELGPAGPPTFARLGVDVESVRPGRQRLAFACLDATERAPHLAGALADALADALIARKWVERAAGGRTIRLTGRGASELSTALATDFAAG